MFQKLKENKNTKYHSDIFSLIRDDIFKTDSYHGSSIRFYPICLEMFFDKYSTEFMKNKLKEYKTKLNTEGNMYKPEAEDIVLQLQLMEQSK